MSLAKVTLKNTDLTVSPLCLGTADYGGAIAEEECRKMLDFFLEAGGTFIDTARVYNDWIPGEKGRSEAVIGRWLKDGNHYEDVVVATKGAHPPLSDMSFSRMSRQEIGLDIDLSLGALGVERIDLYYLHRDDPSVDAGEIIDILEDYRQQGKVKYYACSNWQAQRIREAQDAAIKRGVQGFTADQMRWSLGSSNALAQPDVTTHSMDFGLWNLHKETGMAVAAYNSQAGGFFTKYARDPKSVKDNLYNTPRNKHLADMLVWLQKEQGISVNTVMLGYFLQQPFQTIPIVGCRDITQLRDSVECFEKAIQTVEQIPWDMLI